MPDKTTPADIELTDQELLTVIGNHGLDRRTVMRVLGLGAVATLGSGVGAARHAGGHPPRIDPYYGYSAPASERVPGNLDPDSEVELHIDNGAIFDQDPTTIPFHFEPMGLHVAEGDIIQFTGHTPEHTVTAYHEAQGRQQRVPDSVPPFSSPVLNGGAFWLYQFDEPGVYDLLCAPHEFFGMVMRVVVGDPDDAGFDGTFGPAGQPPLPRPPVSGGELNALGITTFPFPTPHDVFGTDALTVTNIVDSGEVSVSAVEGDL